MATYSYDYLEQTQAVEAEEATPRGKVIVGIDFTTGLGIMENQGLKKIENAEALIQRILKFLRTEKDYYKLYEEQYQIQAGETFGFSVYEAIGHTFTSVILGKYSREIRNFLNGEYDVESINSLQVIPVEDKILIDIVLTSTYDEIEIKEVIGGNSLYSEGA